MNTVNRKWYGDRAFILETLPGKELREVFPNLAWETLRNTRKIYRRRYKDGIEARPEQPNWYKPGMSAEEIQKNLKEEPVKTPEEINEFLVSQKARSDYHKLLDEAIDQANIDPSRIKGFRITSGSHKGYIKNANNEIEYTDELPRKGITISVDPRSFEPSWDMVQPPLADIHPVKKVKRERDPHSKVCVVLPDPQIGYRKFRDGRLDPFHDNAALSVALQIVADLQPDKIVWLGDYLDLPMFGTFEQSEEYAQTAQLAVNYGFKILAKCRATVPGAEIVVIEGNHDRRIEKSLIKNTTAAFGLRQAEIDNFKEFPAFSIPHLLRFNDLDVQYVEGYPAGRYWINERLQCIHGRLIRQAGSTAAAVVKEETVSTLFGHIHRIEQAYITQNVHDGAHARLAHSPGCLCRIDGGVPSAKGSTDLNGEPVINYENWQQGLSVVSYTDGDNSFNLENIYINTIEDHRAVYGGKLYLPTHDVLEDIV